jgi:hypothetical protein
MVYMATFPGGQITHPLFSRFGVAEQAINAIYLLGEQPDKVCDDIIKNLTSRVFNAPPEPVTSDSASDVAPPTPTAARSEAGDTTMDIDVANDTIATPRAKEKTITTDMGDSFKLSQLVFLVGHVSIKHIVHLELIERELKRRKEASLKGALTVRAWYIKPTKMCSFQREEVIAQQARNQRRRVLRNSIKLRETPRTRSVISSRVSRKMR